MALDKDLIDKLLGDYQKPEDLIGENGLLKQLTKALVERALNAELTHHLGYEKNDAEGRGSGNSRNGASRKTVMGDFGEVEIEVPRDRVGEALVNNVVSAGISGLLLETSFKHRVELMKGFLNASVDLGPTAVFQ